MRDRKTETIATGDKDMVFFQNGSMTHASSFGSMTSAPKRLTNKDSGGWVWEKLANDHPEFIYVSPVLGC
jgi:oleate hydratase